MKKQYIPYPYSPPFPNGVLPLAKIDNRDEDKDRRGGTLACHLSDGIFAMESLMLCRSVRM